MDFIIASRVKRLRELQKNRILFYINSLNLFTVGKEVSHFLKINTENSDYSFNKC